MQGTAVKKKCKNEFDLNKKLIFIKSGTARSIPLGRLAVIAESSLCPVAARSNCSVLGELDLQDIFSYAHYN
jgi:hypothetical protein